MASILDRYGIKEVADVTFYTIDENGKPKTPVLYLDTLKVSTIEQSAESSDARGGKGNPKLISWDYGKEINVTIEDALFSSKSMSIMFGNGTVAQGEKVITKNAVLRVGTDGKLPATFVADVYDATAGSKRVKVRMDSNTPASDEIAFDAKLLTLGALTSETGAVIDDKLESTEWSTVDLTSYKGQKVFLTYTVRANAKTITISGDSFPGTYYVVGDTYARSDVDGRDQFFQFVIPKAKVTSENTITLEAEGDPSTFSMSLTVLRSETGEMMQLVQYDLAAPATT